ncbi:MarR family transcriptional regulator [Williamsia sp. CHRR-6]|uniref:MarR family transcriptional regulator n=1 Tax=Williamsia sp. CHRR-6 TaxID=2835871 RepID=UPI001BD9B8F4|nr:MarR family transcriptional regulator [Williamsia sp. CHRR-6]MBT0565729.1 MarR family transcriptional regulator [Williamsia sp. CHRR-6]
MVHPRLTGNQSAVLFVLMSQAREVPNPDLKTLGPELKRTDRDKLAGLGLIEVTKGPRSSNIVALTDAGWSWCAHELTQGPPERATPQIRALYSVLGGLGRHLARSDARLYEIFTAEAVGAATAPVEAVPDSVDERGATADAIELVRATYRRLAPHAGAWVPLAQVRDVLGELSRDSLDAALRDLERQREVGLIPQEDQARLTAADRAAAVTVGTQTCHLLSIA